MAGKILVAEDDPEARELLLLLLEGGEYSLLEAADGMEALDLLRTEQPDLLITDIVMPRMDGYELVRRLRQDDRTANTSVIFCSASYHEREVREMARSLGVQSTLAKPFDLKTVRDDGRRCVRRTHQHALPGPVATPAVPVVGGAQERLSALVAFSRRLFGQTDPETIVESTCHAARDILLAQCAQLVIADGEGPRHACTASGLASEQVERLLGMRMYRDLLPSLEQGGCALYPMSPSDVVQTGARFAAGRFRFDARRAGRVSQPSLRLPVRHQSHRPAGVHRRGSRGRARDRGTGRGRVRERASLPGAARRSCTARRSRERSARAEPGSRAPRRRAHRRAGSRQSRAGGVLVFGRARPARAVAIDPRARADAARLSRLADCARAADPPRSDHARCARDERADRRAAGAVQDQPHGDAARSHVARRAGQARGRTRCGRRAASASSSGGSHRCPRSSAIPT